MIDSDDSNFIIVYILILILLLTLIIFDYKCNTFYSIHTYYGNDRQVGTKDNYKSLTVGAA